MQYHTILHHVLLPCNSRNKFYLQLYWGISLHGGITQDDWKQHNDLIQCSYVEFNLQETRNRSSLDFNE